MLLKIIILLGLSLHLHTQPSESLDFTQFYLPQCCYHPQSGIPATAASNDEVHPFRHDIRARKVDPAQIISLHTDSSSGNITGSTTETSSSTTLSERAKAEKREIKNDANKNSNNNNNKNDPVEAPTERPPMTTRLYRYIVPLEKKDLPRSPLLGRSNEEASSGETTDTETEIDENEESMSTTTPRPNKTKSKSLRKDLKTDFKLKALLSSAQIETELKPVDEVLSSKNKTDTENPEEIETEGENTPSLESLLFPKNETIESMLTKYKRNTATEQPKKSTKARLRQARLNKIGLNHKMPSSWIVNLRRALYQSIDSMLYHTQSKSKGNKNSKNNKSNKKFDSSDETIQAKSSNNFNPNSNQQYSTSSEDIILHNERFSRLWPQLREANLTLVESLTRSETMLPENIYLPMGTGPIASGVVVNTVNGIQLRMANELYFQQDQPQPNLAQGCNCHLIQNGDILMAYWSVSRIINENGNPSLQYLIYPVPYNVPTPPRMENFNTMVLFTPSSRFQQAQNENQPHGHHKNSHRIQIQKSHHSNSYEHQDLPPPYLQETPFDHQIQQQSPQPSFPPNYENIFKHFQQFNQLPPSRAGPLPTKGPSPNDRTDFRGVVIQTENGYTPEFVELYKQAVANHLIEKDHQQHQHSPLEQLQQYIQQQQLLQHQQQQQHQQLPPQSQNPHHHAPPAHITLFDGQLQPHPNPGPNPGPNPNNPNFPKSIQEIISPFPGGPPIQIPIQPGTLLLNQNAGPGPTSLPIIPVSVSGPQQNQHQQQFPGLVNFDPSDFQQHPISGPPTVEDPDRPRPHNKNVNNYYTFDHEGPKDIYDGPIQLPPQQHQPYPQIPQRPQQVHPNYNEHNSNNHNHHHSNYPTHPNPPNSQYRPFYEHGSHGSHGHHNHKPIPNRPTSGGGSGRYPQNSDEEGMRYHRTQQVPQRRRPDTYSRPTSLTSYTGPKRFNQDGSYIINF